MRLSGLGFSFQGSLGLDDLSFQLAPVLGETTGTKDQILPCFLVDEVALPAAVAKLRQVRNYSLRVTKMHMVRMRVKETKTLMLW